MQIKHFAKQQWSDAPSEQTIVKLDGSSTLDRVMIHTKEGVLDIYVASDGTLRIHRADTNGEGLEISPIVSNEIRVRLPRRRKSKRG